MAINPITARRGSAHVTAYDARKLVYALGGPWPHRCVIDSGNFGISVNAENSLFYDVAPGVLVYHGYVIANDATLSEEVTAASGNNYKKSVLYLKITRSASYDLISLEKSYSAEGTSAEAVSYPALDIPSGNSFIITEAGVWYIPLANMIIHGGKIESIEELLPAWDNKQFYGPGDSINISYLIASGYLAANGANIYFYIPFSKSYAKVSGAALSGNFTIRHADGGFIGSNSGQALDSLGTVTVSLYDSGAYVRCVMNEPTALTNQAPISVLASNGARLTFF